MAKLESAVAKETETVSELNVKLREVKMHAVDVAYEKDVLKARLKHFQGVQQKIHDCIVRVQWELDRFRLKLKVDRE